MQKGSFYVHGTVTVAGSNRAGSVINPRNTSRFGYLILILCFCMSVGSD
jgi:hypothetical protein